MNTAIDDENWEFFDGDGDTIIFDCFKAVLQQNVYKSSLMPDRFFNWVTASVSDIFVWPSNRSFSNALKYLREQYRDNVKTNIRTHCKARLTKFFRMCVYELNDHILRQNQNTPLFSDVDIRNAINYTYNRTDTTGGDLDAQRRLGVLLDELRSMGAPDDCNIRDFITNDWFKSLRMWLQIQRAVQYFQLAYSNVYNSWRMFRKYPLNVKRPTYDGTNTIIPEPTSITNFAAIPICKFQRRHIRIDVDVLYALVCEAKEAPQKPGTLKEWRNVTIDEFKQNGPAGNWGIFFDLAKITGLVKGKKTFDQQVVSDGVSVTILYLRPSQPEPAIQQDELKRRYEAGEFW